MMLILLFKEIIIANLKMNNAMFKISENPQRK